MATVFIPAQLQRLTGGTTSVQADAGTVGEAIDQLEERYPGIRARLCDGEQLAAALQVSIDDVLSQQGLRAKVTPDSEVHFLPAIGGG